MSNEHAGVLIQMKKDHNTIASSEQYLVSKLYTTLSSIICWILKGDFHVTWKYSKDLTTFQGGLHSEKNLEMAFYRIKVLYKDLNTEFR